jgi:hypothetical protein
MKPFAALVLFRQGQLVSLHCRLMLSKHRWKYPLPAVAVMLRVYVRLVVRGWETVRVRL